MEWGTILASPITSASQPNSSQGFRVLGFHGSIPVLSGVMHQSQTQRLKPNKHCCWELASPFFAAIHHQHGGFDQQQNLVIWVVYSWLISIFLGDCYILWVSQQYPRHSNLQPWPWVPNNEQVGWSPNSTIRSIDRVSLEAKLCCLSQFWLQAKERAKVERENLEFLGYFVKGGRIQDPSTMFMLTCFMPVCWSIGFFKLVSCPHILTQRSNIPCPGRNRRRKGPSQWTGTCWSYKILMLWWFLLAGTMIPTYLNHAWIGSSIFRCHLKKCWGMVSRLL